MLGLLLIDHGSRRAEANAQLEDMARRVAVVRPSAVVGVAHMEIAQPDIPAGVADLVRRGATDIVALLYFLSDGRHVSTDVPQLLAQACVAFPGVTGRCSTALGPHDGLARLMIERAGLA